MILATVRMAIPPAKHGEVLRILRAMNAHNRSQPGCLSSYIYRDAEEANVLMVEEAWTGEEELERHLRSADYSRLLQVMEMAIENPEIRFNTTSKSSGIEIIERAGISSVGQKES
jgi:quinol monooxygenase YgiN